MWLVSFLWNSGIWVVWFLVSILSRWNVCSNWWYLRVLWICSCLWTFFWFRGENYLHQPMPRAQRRGMSDSRRLKTSRATLISWSRVMGSLTHLCKTLLRVCVHRPVDKLHFSIALRSVLTLTNRLNVLQSHITCRKGMIEFLLFEKFSF